jgi:phosphatidylglycerol:prolipoprotein diacylglycerol transferase
MSFPIYLHIGSHTIHPHFLFEAIAYTFAFRLYLQLRRTIGDPVSHFDRWWVIAAASLGALLGSKLLFLFEDPEQSLQHLRQPALLFSGKTIVGALIGGTIAVEWAKKRLGVTRRTGDLFALPLCVGIAIGRIGCFLTGVEDHTAGVATSLPWGVDFGDTVQRHPTQLYEIVFVIFLGLIVLCLSRRPHLEGDLFRVFMIGYLAFRLCVDFVKPDIRVFAGLSSIQCVCVAALLYYVRDILRWLRGPSVNQPVVLANLTENSSGANLSIIVTVLFALSRLQ